MSDAATAQSLQPLVDRLKPRVGVRTAPIVFEVDKGAIVRYARFTGETNPIYFDEDAARKTKFGGVIAPPTFLSWFLKGIVPDKVFELDLGLATSLHSEDLVQVGVHVRAGDVITAVAELSEVGISPRRDGVMLRQQADVTLTNQRNEFVGTIRIVSVMF